MGEQHHGVKFDLGPTPHLPERQTATTCSAQGSALRDIEKALDRLDRGDFGYCVQCGSEIELVRLCEDPTRTTCLDCKD